MYSRSYPNPGQGLIPPNYSGNAFDLARERREHIHETKQENSGDRSPSVNRRDTRQNRQEKSRSSIKRDHGEQGHSEKKQCAEKEHHSSKSNPFGSLLFRRDGKKIESDDILLAGLIVLLLSSSADEELILILGFLFLAGL